MQLLPFDPNHQGVWREGRRAAAAQPFREESDSTDADSDSNTGAQTAIELNLQDADEEDKTRVDFVPCHLERVCVDSIRRPGTAVKANSHNSRSCATNSHQL